MQRALDLSGGGVPLAWAARRLLRREPEDEFAMNRRKAERTGRNEGARLPTNGRASVAPGALAVSGRWPVSATWKAESASDWPVCAGRNSPAARRLHRLFCDHRVVENEGTKQNPALRVRGSADGKIVTHLQTYPGRVPPSTRRSAARVWRRPKNSRSAEFCC